ncbi:hypothetical protein CCACVL1_21489 [Corchorus capsularis]|uniref:Uncharacterized protein n=1 Tax=Corchorus capsularis TaxID=210143 RepID=A0A1R3H5N0_COCAP|nr:hypothetical protein CCACVL1_21489 [Corchorus capsularis]
MATPLLQLSALPVTALPSKFDISILS